MVTMLDTTVTMEPPADPGGAAGQDICVILNAGSGKRKAKATAAELRELFGRFPGRFALRVVRSGSQIEAAARRALAEGFPTIVAAGGDGTICTIAGCLAGTGRTFGVLPLGTFNYFARSLDLPEALEDAVRVLAEGHTRTIGMGEVNGRPFLNNSSLGAYAVILHNRENVYRRWGRSRLIAYWSVLTTLARFRHPLTLKVTVDNEVRRFRTPLAFVACNPRQLELLGLEGPDCIRAGKFALFIAPDCSRLELLRYALRLALHAMQPGRDFELICGTDIAVDTRQRRRLVARDGERERMTGPFRFHFRQDALRVLVPAAPP
jgi:diacylglycerol kinase family enzyme